MISNERPFEWCMWQYLEKSNIFFSQWWRNKVLYLTSNFIFLTFWSIQNYQHTKNILMIYNLSMLIKKWIPVAPCFRFFLTTELKKMWNISFLPDFQILVFEYKMISNERPFEWCICLCSEKKSFPYLPVMTS